MTICVIHLERIHFGCPWKEISSDFKQWSQNITFRGFTSCARWMPLASFRMSSWKKLINLNDRRIHVIRNTQVFILPWSSLERYSFLRQVANWKRPQRGPKTFRLGGRLLVRAWASLVEKLKYLVSWACHARTLSYLHLIYFLARPSILNKTSWARPLHTLRSQAKLRFGRKWTQLGLLAAVFRTKSGFYCVIIAYRSWSFWASHFSKVKGDEIIV